ncbi:MAG: MAPEG family protein [Sphingopyxis sp.]|nr:MAPEG family protein [Sphingopyxis sp.]
MVDYRLLAPGAILALWTLIMLLWVAATRFPAIAKTGMDVKTAPPGGRGQDLEAVLPPNVNWKSHNYTHLLEQPTLFYAVITFLTLAGGVTQVTLGLAWAYTAIRIIHSLYQATINVVMVRFGIFVLSTICLLALTVMAVIATLG